MPIKAVVFDLDDTLYPEKDYVMSGFSAVAEYAQAALKIERAKSELVKLFENSRAGVFDRFAKAHGFDEETAKRLTELYREHMPKLRLSDEVKQTLVKLRDVGYKLGIITDGRPQGQRNKITALGLTELTDEIIITDELGGAEFRKPHPKAFELMCERLNITPEQMLYVGDNPQKDFAIKQRLPVLTARAEVDNNGLYADSEYLYGIRPDYEIRSVGELDKLLK
ncbi:HAD family hydrolase [Anaerocaecibacter muris]|uniref:HAD family hydrolase n=1 Tax=Anaerocaecibacter muris TaxID=2941513 RepID=UPI00203EE50E|nr:HAD-IA family hydrolase [Anaerocaecibacter muris]